MTDSRRTRGRRNASLQDLLRSSAPFVLDPELQKKDESRRSSDKESRSRAPKKERKRSERADAMTRANEREVKRSSSSSSLHFWKVEGGREGLVYGVSGREERGSNSRSELEETDRFSFRTSAALDSTFQAREGRREVEGE